MAEIDGNDLLHHRRLPPSPSSTATAPPQMPKPPNLPDLSAARRHHFSPPAFDKRLAGMPPTHPHARLPSPYPQISPPAATHSRSLSQPSFFSLDSLPPMSPSLPPAPTSDSDQTPTPTPTPNIGLPPRKAYQHHRRSQSDIPFGINSQMTLPSHPPLPVKREHRSEAEVVDDLVNSYMDLDKLDVLNSSGTDDNKGDDLDSRASGTRAASVDGSENEAESRATSSAERKDGNKRHCRSLSMDSFMGLGKLNYGDESPKLSGGGGGGSMDEAVDLFVLEAANAEFSEAEKKKIMANERLVEMAMTDPKRVKRILANRQSAARSKERKMRYISELEHKVQILQTEATTLSAQLTLLQRDSEGLASQNNQLKIRLQAMEQQAQLRDALNEALTAEVQRLKLATGEISDPRMPKGLHDQVNSQMLQLQIQQQQQQQQQRTQRQQRTEQQQQQSV